MSAASPYADEGSSPVEDSTDSTYKAEDSAAGLDRFPLYPGGVWLLCAVLRKLDLDAALSLRNVLTWSFVGLTGIGGAAACLYRRLRRC